ncbi:MAG: SpoIIIAH-like family protein [Oscillospiraceae bacterium]|jgi:hypothetical protein|nr:SpoIIIAH-like family protein [Oscillospiraceae bacterium]
MTYNLFTVRQPSSALSEPVVPMKSERTLAKTAKDAQSSPAARSARIRSPLTLLVFQPKRARQSKPAKPTLREREVYQSTTVTNKPASPTLAAANAAHTPTEETVMNRPMIARGTVKSSRLTSTGARIAAMSGLCLLLVVSGAWAAVSRSPSNIVGIPVTIRQNVPDPAVTAQPSITPEPGSEGETTLTTLSSFMTYKQQMDAARSQSISMLDALIADVNADAATLEQARGEKLTLAKSIATEATLQGLMAARGFGDSYVTVRPGSVNVVVRQEKLSSQQMASILEMVTAETGESPDSVKIILTK